MKRSIESDLQSDLQSDAQQTQPLSCFSIEPMCEGLVAELERVLEREERLAAAAERQSAGQAQPDGPLVERAGR